MPNTVVDMDSRTVSACYPQSSFCPLSDGLSTQHHLVIRTDFRLSSRCLSHCQAGFCPCTHQLIPNQPEPTFARLRYLLGGDRPSQTAPLTLSLIGSPPISVSITLQGGWYPTIGSRRADALRSLPPTYPVHLPPLYHIRIQ